ncbi:MAG: 2Fe-2S iron-sulfur cluster-binding protein [Maritimibacter sp.]
MSQFHPLTVTNIEHTIRDAIVVTLDAGDADFSFLPGQHLTFRREFDGLELRRSYSICVPRGGKTLRVGIKRVEGGAFSNWANETLKVGDTIEAMPPSGVFHIPHERAPRTYLGFAGGSGITPILSMLTTLLDEEPASTFTLVYANRAVNTIMFRSEIEDLKNRYMGRLSVVHVLENDAQEIDLFTGRVDEAKCAALFAAWIDIGSIDQAYICGPEPMMKSIAAALNTHGLGEDQIHYELFVSAQPGRLAQKVAAAKADSGEVAAEITIDGATRRIKMGRKTSVLEAALANDIAAPYACTKGVCSTCIARVTKGEVEMQANHALEDHEVADGYVLTCQCYPLSNEIALDYDDHH